MQPFKALIVEGTSGAGKSTLIDALLRRHIESRAPRKIRSLVHLAQSHTYGPLAIAENGGTLTVAQNLTHLDGIVAHLKWLHASVQEHDRPWSFAVLDTLHLTHCVRPGVVMWQDVITVDSRLAALGCKLVFLEASPERSGRAEFFPAATNSSFSNTHANSDQRSRPFTNTSSANKRRSRNLFEQSAMPKLLLDAKASVESLIEQSYAFWLAIRLPRTIAQ